MLAEGSWKRFSLCSTGTESLLPSHAVTDSPHPVSGTTFSHEKVQHVPTRVDGREAVDHGIARHKAIPQFGV